VWSHDGGLRGDRERRLHELCPDEHRRHEVPPDGHEDDQRSHARSRRADRVATHGIGPAPPARDEQQSHEEDGAEHRDREAVVIDGREQPSAEITEQRHAAMLRRSRDAPMTPPGALSRPGLAAREREPERRPAAFRRGADPATSILDELAHDREADPGATAGPVA